MTLREWISKYLPKGLVLAGVYLTSIVIIFNAGNERASDVPVFMAAYAVWWVMYELIKFGGE